MRVLVEKSDVVEPGLSGAIREWRGAGRVWAVMAEGNLLAAVAATPRVPAAVERLVVEPGCLVRVDDETGETMPDPRTWGQLGWERFEGALKRMVAECKARVVVRPAAGQVVSDAPSTLRLLERLGEWGGRVGVLVDPVGMLVESMLARAEDHVVRVIEQLGGRAGVEGVVVSNARLVNGRVERADLRDGVIPVDVLAALVRTHVPAEVPIVLTGEGIDDQAALLGRGSGGDRA